MTHTVKIASKQTEQLVRGQAEEYILRTPDIRIPPSFCQFLSNSCNKERILELIEQVLCEEKNDMKDRVFYFTRKEACMKIMSKCSAEVPCLVIEHVEGRYKDLLPYTSCIK